MTVVTIEVNNPLWNKRHLYSQLISKTIKYTGEIVKIPSWATQEQIALTTSDPKFPIRLIEKSNIIGQAQSKRPIQNDKRSWQVAGSKPGSEYTVTQNKNAWSCTCAGYGFRRKCRHIDEIKITL